MGAAGKRSSGSLDLDLFLQRFEKGIDIFVVTFVIGPRAYPLRGYQVRALQGCEVKRCSGLRKARALLDDADAHAYCFRVDFLLGKVRPGILEPIEDVKARRVRQGFQGFVDVNVHKIGDTCFSRYCDIFVVRTENWKAPKVTSASVCCHKMFPFLGQQA